MARRLRRSHGRGTRLLAPVLALLLGSCLVTRQVDYEEPFLPSVITLQRPTTQIWRAPVVRDPECDREGLKGDVYFQVAIEDLNRSEPLDIQVRVDDLPGGTGRVTPDQRPQGFQFCVDFALLSRPCTRIEVFASSDFERDNRPRHEGDIARAHWWVLAPAVDDPTASHLDCEADLTDGGAAR